MVSNYGRVWHRYLGKFFCLQQDTDGYWHGTFARKKLPQKRVSIHRLVMMEFNYIQGCENLFINHKDGNTSNNMITNLEWCTASENSIHSVHVLGNRTKPKADENVNKIIDDIYNEIIKGELSFKEIAIKYNVPFHYVKSISDRIITKENGESSYIPRYEAILNDNQIHEICKYLSENCKDFPSKEQYIEIMNRIGYNYNNEKIRNMIKRIYKREKYFTISKDYDW